MKKILLFLFLLPVFILNGQITVNYQQRILNYAFTAQGASGAFNQGSYQIGMYSNGGDPKTVVGFRSLKTAGDNTGSARSLKVGDEFRISLSAHTVRGYMGFALLCSPTATNSYAERKNNAAISMNLDIYGNWYAQYYNGTTINASTSTGSTLIGGTTSYRNFVFVCKLTAPNRMNITLTEGANTSNFYDLLLNSSNPITDYSIWLADDYNGVSSNNIYWNTNSGADADYVKNTGTLEIGASNGVFSISGVIPDGLVSNSTSTSSANAVSKTGTGAITLSGTNTYSGLTTVSAGTLQLNRTGGTTIPATNNVTVSGTGNLKISTNQILNNLSVASGTLTVDNGATLTINGTFTGGGTIVNNGKIVVIGPSSFPGATTTVSAMSDLEINRAGGVLLDKSLTLTGTLTLTAGTFTVGTNTLTLNGPAIAGTPITLATTSSSNLSFGGSSSGVNIPSSVVALNNLTVSNATGVTSNSNIAISGTMSVSGLFIPQSSDVISGAGTLNGSGTIQVKRATGTADFTNQYSITNKTLSSLTVEMAGASAQGLAANTFGGLKINNSSGVSLNSSSDVTVGGTLTFTSGNLTIGSNTLTLNGAVSTTSGSLTGSTTSNLTIGGSGLGQSLNFISGSRTLKDFTLNSSATATLNTPLTIVGGSSPGTVTLASSSTLTTGGNLTLQSDANGTARVGNSSGSISGNVTVERYIPPNRKWRSVSVPLIGSSFNTIYNNWQNNGTPAGSTGVALWKPGGGNGFASGGGSANILKYVSGSYTAVTNTETEELFNSTGPKPFMVYVTGPYGSSNIASGSDPTTLRAIGTLVQGGGSFGYTGLSTGFHYITNPYPSDIDFSTVTRSADIPNTIYVWDPQLSGTYGQGNYQTTANGVTTPKGGSYGASDYTIIKQGASFFIYNNGPSSGSLTFAESNKVSSAALTNIFGRTNNGSNEVFRANILVPAAGNVLTDGVATVYNNNGNVAITKEDALKFNSPSEGIAIIRENKNFAIEVRPLIDNSISDTIFLRLLNMNQTNYKLELKAEYFDTNPGFEAVLKDSYTNTSTPVSLVNTTNYNFTVDANTASTGDRFMIVFRNTNPLPVNITSIKATQKATTVVVDWTVENEVNLKEYQVQKSTDGRNFETLNIVKANNSKAYSSIDNAPSQGANYYRVVSISNDGKKQYSSIVMVKFGVKNSSVGVYPNPIKGNTVNLQLQNIDKGDYELQVINTLGQVLFSKPIQHNGGSASQSVQLPNNVAKGNYVLKLANQESILYSEKIILE